MQPPLTENTGGHKRLERHRKPGGHRKHRTAQKTGAPQKTQNGTKNRGATKNTERYETGERSWPIRLMEHSTGRIAIVGFHEHPLVHISHPKAAISPCSFRVNLWPKRCEATRFDGVGSMVAPGNRGSRQNIRLTSENRWKSHRMLLPAARGVMLRTTCPVFHPSSPVSGIHANFAHLGIVSKLCSANADIL